MITIREYYSGVLEPDDETRRSKCNSCGEVFPTLEILLNIPEHDDYDESEITEHCPFCEYELPLQSR